MSKKVRCERASIDEVYLDLTEAAEKMLAETPPESLEAISEEALKSHVLGLHLVLHVAFFTFSFFIVVVLFYVHIFYRSWDSWGCIVG